MGLMSFTNMYFIEYNLAHRRRGHQHPADPGHLPPLQRWVVQAVVMSGLKG